MPHRMLPRGMVASRYATEARRGLDESQYLRELRERYRFASRVEKSRLLDDLVRVGGFHRKHAIRLLRRDRPTIRSRYDRATIEALKVVWESSGRACGKRLKAMLPDLVPAMVADGRLPRDPLVRVQLLSISAATIDRALASSQRAASVGEFEEKSQAAMEALGELEQMLASGALSTEERLLVREQYSRGAEAVLRKLRAALPLPSDVD
jgi:hypothetical protein